MVPQTLPIEEVKKEMKTTEIAHACTHTRHQRAFKKTSNIYSALLQQSYIKASIQSPLNPLN